MSNERSNHKAQTAMTIARNKRVKAERHNRRMVKQCSRDKLCEDHQPKVPRGTARNLRRKHLQEAYAKRAALL